MELEETELTTAEVELLVTAEIDVKLTVIGLEFEMVVSNGLLLLVVAVIDVELRVVAEVINSLVVVTVNDGAVLVVTAITPVGCNNDVLAILVVEVEETNEEIIAVVVLVVVTDMIVVVDDDAGTGDDDITIDDDDDGITGGRTIPVYMYISIMHVSC